MIPGGLSRHVPSCPALAKPSPHRNVAAAQSAGGGTAVRGAIRDANADLAASRGAGRAAAADAADCSSPRLADAGTAAGRAHRRAAAHAGPLRAVLWVANAGPAAVRGAGRAPACRSGGRPASGAVRVARLLACRRERPAGLARAPRDHAREPLQSARGQQGQLRHHADPARHRARHGLQRLGAPACSMPTPT